MAAAACACVSGPVVNLSTINAKAGQEVGITGTGFQAANAAQIRWNALDGPVLTTVPAPITGGNLDAKFTVPAGTQPGSYVVIVSQTKADGSLSLSPVRAVMNVTGDAGTNPVLGASAASVDQTVARRQPGPQRRLHQHRHPGPRGPGRRRRGHVPRRHGGAVRRPQEHRSRGGQGPQLGLAAPTVRLGQRTA